MQIFLRNADSVVALNVEQHETIENIYEHVIEQNSCARDDFLISYCGRIVDSSKTIGQHDFLPGAVLDITMKIRGGKVHGKLNNAGKVKNQTPKIAPEEKPKKKTGRARRREQYARRFSQTVVNGNGHRHGPNSQFS